jgi:hypothetical protein
MSAHGVNRNLTTVEQQVEQHLAGYGDDDHCVEVCGGVGTLVGAVASGGTGAAVGGAIGVIGGAIFCDYGADKSSNSSGTGSGSAANAGQTGTDDNSNNSGEGTCNPDDENAPVCDPNHPDGGFPNPEDPRGTIAVGAP